MKLTILLIPLILLSSCSIDWNDEKVDFEKKKYCAELKTNGFEESKIHQKFYSPARDTCIYWEMDGGSHRLYDALTKEFITGTFIEGESPESIESWRIFQADFKKLKGE